MLFITNQMRPQLTWLTSLFFCLAALAGPTAAAAETDELELELEAQLICGTNDPVPASKERQKVDPKLKTKLAHVFKWKNYYLVKSQRTKLKAGDTRQVRMDAKYALKMHRHVIDVLEIKLFGEGKWTKTVRQPVTALRKGEIAVLAGDDQSKQGDAWFVVISAPKKPSTTR